MFCCLDNMIDIKLLNEDDVVKNEIKLVHFMYMVLTENVDFEVSNEMCKTYYKNMKKFVKDGSAILFGAFNGEVMVGFHWGFETYVNNRKRIHSYFNAIEPEFRGQKIGSRFFVKLEEEAKKRNIYEIEAMCTYSNTGAVNYHLKNGFEIERLKVLKKLEADHDN